MKPLLTLCAAGLIGLAGCHPYEKQTEEPGKIPVAPVKVQTLQKRAETVLKAGFSDSSPYMRNHAIEIAVITNQKQLISDVMGMLNDSSVPVRFSATVAIGDMACPTCHDAITRALQDTDANVRIAAVYSQMKLGDKSGFQQIRDAAVSTDATLRANALLLLGKLGDKSNMDLLYQATKDIDAADKVHIQAAESLALLKDIRIYKTKLWPLLISKFADDRVMGIRGMGALGTRETREAIQTMLKDEVLEVRLAAAEELGKLGDYSGTEQVVKYFATNPNLDEATMATGSGIMAIGRIKAHNLTGFLDKGLRSQSPYIRLAAAQSILLMTQ